MRPALLALAGLTIVTIAPAAALAGWSEAARIAPADGAQLTSASVAGDGGARTLAAWVRSSRRGADARIVVASGTRGQWGAPRALSGRGASLPRTAVNALGDGAVAWINRGTIVAAVRRGPAGRWSVARVAEADGAVQDLRLSIDRTGRPAVLWSESREGGFVARIAARASVRAGWSVRPARLATAGPSPPALALGPGSGALVAWTQGSRALGARTVRGDFERPVEISSDARGRPAVAIGRSGALLTAWSARLPGGTSVVLAAGRENAGDVWGGSEDVGIGATPVAALNDEGDAVIAWSLAAPGAPQGIEAATRSGGGSWRASTVVPRRSCECALRVGGVAIDEDGTAVVAWRRDERGRPPGGGAAALQAGKADWRRTTVGGGRPDAPPAVTADGDAGPVAVWASARDGVRAAVLRP